MWPLQNDPRLYICFTASFCSCLLPPSLTGQFVGPPAVVGASCVGLRLPIASSPLSQQHVIFIVHKNALFLCKVEYPMYVVEYSTKCLRDVVHSRTFFTPKIHPTPTTWLASPPASLSPCPPTDQAHHPTLPATLPATPPCLPAFPDSLARLVSHDCVASVVTR